jgi:hypothetical protein
MKVEISGSVGTTKTRWHVSDFYHGTINVRCDEFPPLQKAQGWGSLRK